MAIVITYVEFDQPPPPANSQVRLTVEQLDPPLDERAEGLRELGKLWDTEEIKPGPPPLSRDRLHDRE